MPLIDFLSSLPLWLLALGLNVFLVGIALGGVWLVRRRVMPRLRLVYDDSYFAAAAVQSVMLLYSLIAALTAVGVWQRYTDVSNVVSAEATAIASLWRDLSGYPAPVREQAQDILRQYSEQIVQRAWPMQQRGEIPREGVEWMDRLQSVLFAFEPVTEFQKVLHGETLRSFKELVQQRRQRLDSVQAALPGVMWCVLLPGAVGCIVLFLFFHVDSAGFQSLLMAGIASFIAMVLFVIVALDRPFSGDMGISADSYQLVIDHHMKN